MRNPIKSVVHRALLKEQGHICCYCGGSIREANSHIEHLRPKSLFPRLDLEYSNLLACCQGDTQDPPPKQIHCGHKKGDWYDETLMVSPLSPDCESYFRYTSFGEILPTEDSAKRDAAEATIFHLGLECSKLTAARKRALDSVLEVIDTLNEDQARELARKLDQPGPSGRYAPFCEAIVYVIRQYFQS
jgi:uncharacterized protein (TIGR02646 family)